MNTKELSEWCKQHNKKTLIKNGKLCGLVSLTFGDAKASPFLSSQSKNIVRCNYG